ncbi:MAG: hypothetical protein CMJ18_21290 [Phycisphaeraceae bacterium]|nr:hypothetical protein [Phycisphaeraceae bacterium]
MSDCAQAWQRDVETSRVRYIPEQSGRPLKVLGVCLPFVLVRRPDGRHVTLDLRRHHVVRLSKSYGRRAFAGIAANSRDKTANKCT